MSLKNKTLLIVGGTGSFGAAFLFHLLENHNELQKIIIFSRDEQKQYELSNRLSLEQKRKVKFFIGDIRDRHRLGEIMTGVHIVVYAAAMKHMPIAEANPEECYKTNVIGTQNLVDAALECKAEKVIALSTDKAVLPINVYGASKLFLEKIIIHANVSPKNVCTKLCAVRYANVLGSRGSVVPLFLQLKSSGEFPITDFRMTRFSINLQQGIDIVKYALKKGLGGEIFIPKTPSYKITTVAEAIAKNNKQKEIGIRNSEKISELLISRFESSRTLEYDNCYIILPEIGLFSMEDYQSLNGGSTVPLGFEYDSATNIQWLTIDQLRNQIENL